MSDVKYPNITVKLSDEDGNIFSIIGRVRRGLEEHGVSNEEIEEFTETVMKTPGYDEALQAVMSWVNVC